MAPSQNASSVKNLHRRQVRRNKTLKSLEMATNAFRRRFRARFASTLQVLRYKQKVTKTIKILRSKLKSFTEIANSELHTSHCLWKERNRDQKQLKTLKHRVGSANFALKLERKNKSALQQQNASLLKQEIRTTRLMEKTSMSNAEQQDFINKLMNEMVELRRPERQVSDGTIIEKMRRLQHEIFEFVDDDITENTHDWQIEKHRNLFSERAYQLLSKGHSKTGTALIQSVVWETIMRSLLKRGDAFGAYSAGPIRVAQDMLRALEHANLEKDDQYKAWLRKTKTVIDKAWPEDFAFAQEQLIEKTKKNIDQALVEMTDVKLTNSQLLQLNNIVKFAATLIQILRNQTETYFLLHWHTFKPNQPRYLNESQMEDMYAKHGDEVDCMSTPMLLKSVKEERVVITKAEVLCLGPETTITNTVQSDRATGRGPKTTIPADVPTNQAPEAFPAVSSPITMPDAGDTVQPKVRPNTDPQTIITKSVQSIGATDTDPKPTLSVVIPANESPGTNSTLSSAQPELSDETHSDDVPAA